MHKPKSINELLASGGKRVAALKAQSEARSVALEHVCAALPETLATAVVSAGIQNGRLTIGVAGAPWAARLRYVTETLRMRVSASMGIGITSVRIKVVPPRLTTPVMRSRLGFAVIGMLGATAWLLSHGYQGISTMGTCTRCRHWREVIPNCRTMSS